MRADGADDFAIGTQLRTTFGPQSRAAIEVSAAQLQGLRGTSAEHKVPISDWWVDTESVQQATPIAIARWRAQTLRSRGIDTVYDLTCSVGTELAAAVQAGLHAYGSDISAARVSLAQRNMAALTSCDEIPAAGHVDGGTTPHTGVWVADALAPTVRQSWSARSNVAVIADPARRVSGRRVRDPEAMLPPLSELTATWKDSHLVIKCAPGIDYAQWPGEVEILSIGGAVKEATLYSPSLCGSVGTSRRAVVIDKNGDTTVWENSPENPEPAAHCSRHDGGTFGAYMMEPDGAVIRAGLVQECAAELGLWMPDKHIAFLTGDQAPVGQLCSEVWETVPLKSVRQTLKKHNVGRVEVLVRGVDMDPDRARKSWKLKGSKAATVFVMRCGDSAVAVVGSQRSAGVPGV